MKKLFSLFLAAMLLFGAAGALAEDASAATTLVVYFSHAGENYSVGVIEEGNTAKMGKIIAEQLNADIFEIVPVVPYPEGYQECCDVAQEEQRANARPEYEGAVENWDQYDTVFIGFPIWWGEVPNIVYTFMEAYDFTGKTVIPFNTHEGSGASHSQRDIEGLATGTTVLQGLAIRGSKAQNDADGTTQDVQNWLKNIGLAE